MADHSSDPTDEVPEADLLEQRAALDPGAEGDDAAGAAPTDAELGAELDRGMADPADRQEQLTAVGDDDEDYPHE